MPVDIHKKFVKKSHRLSHLIAIFIVISVLLVLVGKLLFNTDSPNLFLYLYGASVTLVLTCTFFVSFVLYKDPYHQAKKVLLKNPHLDKEPKVSVMVPVYNEEKVIRQCIESILGQDYKNKEIIFVNDASTDNTKEILDEYQTKGLIQVIHLEENVMKKRALGKAMEIATGTIFAFTDSDTVIAPDAISKIVKIFNAYEHVGAVSGHVRAYNANESFLAAVQDSWYEGQFSVRKAFESYFGVVSCVSGPLAVFRREAVYNYIPAWVNDQFLGQEFKFATDRTLTSYVLGGRWLGKRYKNKFKDHNFVTKENYPNRVWSIVYTKSARAWTVVPDTFRRVIRQQVRWKKSFIRNTFLTGGIYYNFHFLPALFYYLHILFVFIGPFIVYRHFISLPLKGNWYAGLLYMAGILFVGFSFGLAFKIEDPKSKYWKYRPLMSLLSTFVLTWLVYYSLLTIKKMVWHRN